MSNSKHINTPLRVIKIWIQIKKITVDFELLSCPQKKSKTLLPMIDTDSDYSEETFKQFKEHFNLIRINLENNDFTDFEQFYTQKNIKSDEHYYNIIRAGIK